MHPGAGATGGWGALGGDAAPGVLNGAEADHQRARGLRLAQDTDRHFRDDAEQSFGAGDDPHQVVACGLRRLAADAQDLARHQHDLAAEHVVGGHAVFQAVCATGIEGDVATNGAD